MNSRRKTTTTKTWSLVNNAAAFLTLTTTARDVIINTSPPKLNPMNLSTASTEYIEGFIQGATEQYSINEPIDPDYKLTFFVMNSDARIKVTYVWTMGKTRSNTGDPAFNNSEPKENDGYFQIFKNTSECTFEKLRKCIVDAIEEVTKEPFNPVMERESC